MGVRFQCPNGHQLHVKAHLAGKRGICPECNVRFVVPSFNGGRAVIAAESPGSASAPEAPSPAVPGALAAAEASPAQVAAQGAPAPQAPPLPSATPTSLAGSADDLQLSPPASSSESTGTPQVDTMSTSPVSASRHRRKRRSQRVTFFLMLATVILTTVLVVVLLRSS